MAKSLANFKSTHQALIAAHARDTQKPAPAGGMPFAAPPPQPPQMTAGPQPIAPGPQMQGSAQAPGAPVGGPIPPRRRITSP